MKPTPTPTFALAFLTTFCSALGYAQDAAQRAPESEASGELQGEIVAGSPEEAAARRAFESVEWLDGPATGDLGARAKVETPAGLRFANGRDTRKLMELMQNPVSGGELGLVGSPDLSWFVVFEFDESGYIDDEDRDSLDADELLESLREGQAEGNKARSERGWETIEVVGWATPPYYDATSNNLEWATKARSSGGGLSINHNSRALGRHGVMVITLVTGPEAYEAVLPQFREMLAGFQFKSGERYSEFTSGDRVAEYGLTALVAGGIGAAAVKTGMLGKLWKFIVAGLVAAGMFLKRIFGGGGSKSERAPRRAGSARDERTSARASVRASAGEASSAGRAKSADEAPADDDGDGGEPRDAGRH
jgi:uncharacterized membrane-anchored protein